MWWETHYAPFFPEIASVISKAILTMRLRASSVTPIVGSQAVSFTIAYAMSVLLSIVPLAPDTGPGSY